MEVLIQQNIGNTILLIVFALLLKKRIRLIEAVIFLIPFRAIYYEIGLSISAAQILMLFGLILTVLKSPFIIKIPKMYLPYLFYVIISTVFISTLIIPEFISVKQGNFLREEGRFITQLIYLTIFIFGFLTFLNTEINSKEQLKYVLRIFLIAQQVLIIIGFVQLLIVSLTGVDITPIGIGTSNERTGLTDIMGQRIVRISSLAGEPKGLAATLSVGLAILVVMQKFNYQIIKNQRLWTLLFLISILLTFSSGGFILIILLPISILLLDTLKLRLKRTINKNVVWSLVVVIILSVVYRDVVYAIIDARILKRVEIIEGKGEDFDATIIAFLADNPIWIWFGSGSGNIHNLATPYIPKEYKHFMTGDTIFLAKSGWLRIISENGLVGFILFLIFIGYYLFRLNSKFKKHKFSRVLFYALFITVVYYFARGNYVLEELYFLIGLTLIFIRLQSNVNKSVRKI